MNPVVPLRGTPNQMNLTPPVALRSTRGYSQVTATRPQAWGLAAPGAELRSGLKPSASCGGGVRSECNRDRRFSQLFMYLSHYSRFSPQNSLHASSCPQDAGNSGRFYGLVTFEPLVNLASKGYREWFRFAALEVREIHARLRSAGLRFVSPEASALNRCK